ncbi:hypothetical protein ACFQ0T_23745 [Kitasatospora gansuensis]
MSPATVEQVRRALDDMHAEAVKGRELLRSVYRSNGSLDPMRKLAGFADGEDDRWAAVKGQLPTQLTGQASKVNELFDEMTEDVAPLQLAPPRQGQHPGRSRRRTPVRRWCGGLPGRRYGQRGPPADRAGPSPTPAPDRARPRRAARPAPACSTSCCLAASPVAARPPRPPVRRSAPPRHPPRTPAPPRRTSRRPRNCASPR